MEEVGRTMNGFSKKFIKIPQCWLQDCIDFYKRQEDTVANYTQDELEQFVYMQWLLFDIREKNIPVLPANINQEKKYDLKETITLQLLSIIDISRSKYSQLQKIRYQLEKPLESDVTEFDYKGDSKRCLQLTLTDGIQEVQAFEYKLLKILNINLRPGMKIRFIAPLTIRYGQIMLENESNILLLGGEVQEIVISNAPENILAAALNLPLNKNPVAIENIQQNVTNHAVIQNPQRNTNQMATKNNFMNRITSTIETVNNSEPCNAVKPIIEDDEFDMLMEIENELHGNKNINSVQICKPKAEKPKCSANIFARCYEENIDYMLDLEDEIQNEQIDIRQKKSYISSIDNKHAVENKSKSSTVSKDPKILNKTAHITCNLQEQSKDATFGIGADIKSKVSIEKLSITEDISHDMTEYEPFKSSQEVIEILSSPDKSPKKKQKVNRDPHINPLPSTSQQIFKERNETKMPQSIASDTTLIKSLQTKSVVQNEISFPKCISLNTLCKTQITTGKFKVNAKFKKVIDKLTLKDEKWYIKLQIEDLSGTLDVPVDYELINKLIGYTYEQLKIFAQIGGQQFKDALDNFKSKLQTLDGVLEISFANKEPRLTNIL